MKRIVRLTELERRLLEQALQQEPIPPWAIRAVAQACGSMPQLARTLGVSKRQLQRWTAGDGASRGSRSPCRGSAAYAVRALARERGLLEKP